MKVFALVFFSAGLVGIFVSGIYAFSLRRIFELNRFYGNESRIQFAQKKLPPLPVLKDEAVLPPTVSAESVLIVDVDSGVDLYKKDPDKKLLPASTTKIITALVSMDNYDLNDVVTIGKINVPGQKMGLVEGEKITVADLISGLLIYSANDAAEALASIYPGGREAFVEAMNAKAMELGLEDSVFTNPSGLDGNGLVTTARDLSKEALVAMKIPFFRKVVGTKETTVTSIDGVYRHKLTNINELIGQVPGVLGIKTGWTENAKENLVSYVERENHRVIVVVLGSSDRFGETRSLIEWVFGNFKWTEVNI
jgi:D-alanyl-D-alanine carboxypeptidase